MELDKNIIYICMHTYILNTQGYILECINYNSVCLAINIKFINTLKNLNTLSAN